VSSVIDDALSRARSDDPSSLDALSQVLSRRGHGPSDLFTPVFLAREGSTRTESLVGVGVFDPGWYGGLEGYRVRVGALMMSSLTPGLAGSALPARVSLCRPHPNGWLSPITLYPGRPKGEREYLVNDLSGWAVIESDSLELGGSGLSRDCGIYEVRLSVAPPGVVIDTESGPVTVTSVTLAEALTTAFLGCAWIRVEVAE